MDLSHLDKKYFIDPYVYNCPFCKRNNVTYDLISTSIFDWNNEKKCAVYFVRCNSCKKESLHFSFSDLRAKGQYGSVNDFKKNLDIDKDIFFSQPSSFFTLDDRIDSKIRDLIWEAEQCRRANLLTGASGCLRKAIYVLLKKEESIIINEKTHKTDYKKSMKTLKEKFSGVSPELFDILTNIQELSSDPLHEESWEAWDSTKLRFLIELVETVVEEIYVIPDDRKKRLSSLTEFKKEFENGKQNTKTTDTQ